MELYGPKQADFYALLAKGQICLPLLSCPPGKPEALAMAVRGSLGMSGNERTTMGNRGLQTYLKRQNRDVLIMINEQAFLQATISD